MMLVEGVQYPEIGNSLIQISPNTQIIQLIRKVNTYLQFCVWLCTSIRIYMDKKNEIYIFMKYT